MALAVAVTVILVLSAVLVALYIQTKDYHDAKYRAQYIIVTGMVGDLISVSDGVAGIADGTVTGDLRIQIALIQVDRLNSLQRSAKTLGAMYYNDLDRFGPLSVMADALNGSATFLWWLVQGNNWLLPNVTNLLATSGTVMELLSGELAKGIDPAKDWTKDPYSLVNRMDLAKIQELSGQLASLAS